MEWGGGRILNTRGVQVFYMAVRSLWDIESDVVG